MIKPFRYIGLVTGLAISFLTPCFLTTALCLWLKSRFGAGDWVVLLGILFGLASGFVSAYKSLARFMKDVDRQQKEYDDQFR